MPDAPATTTSTSPAPAAGGAPATGAAASPATPAGTPAASAPAPVAAAAAAAPSGAAPANVAGAGQGAEAAKPFWGGEPVKLALPKDVTLDPKIAEAWEKHITEAKLSPEQVKPFLDNLPRIREAWEADKAKAATTEHQRVIGEWQKAVSDPQLSSDARSVFERFAKANPEDAKALGEFYEKTGTGWFPQQVKLFGFIGKLLREATSEDSSVVPTNGTKREGPPTDEERAAILFNHPSSQAYRKSGSV